MSEELQAVKDFWLSVFPEGSPAPTTDQVQQWLHAYGLEETLVGLRAALKKHNALSRSGRPMTLPQFLAYAIAVMRNRKDRTLPVPRLLCESCGKPINEQEPKAQTGTIQ